MTLKEYFEDHKQNRLAMRLGMDKGTFSRKVNGKMSWTAEDAVRIERETKKIVTRHDVMPNFDWTLFK